MADPDSITNPSAEHLVPVSLEDINDKYRKVGINEGGFASLLERTFETEHSVDLLHAIEQDPRIGLAVQELEFQPGDGGWDSSYHGSAESESKLEALQTHPIDMVNLGLTPEEKTQWRADIDDGDHSAAFAVLITKLPNLRSLYLFGDIDLCKPYLDKVFKHANDTLNTTILSKLTAAYVAHSDSEGTENLEIVDELIFIPSLRKFSGHMLGSEDGDAEYQCLQTKNSDTRVSNIEEVELTYCGMLHNDIAEFIKPLPNLTKLDFDPYSCTFIHVYMGEDGDVQTFRNGFEEDAGDMLRERSLVWKANDGKLKIRKKGVNDSDLDGFDEGMEGDMKKTDAVLIMPDGTERHTVAII